jgi:hypothetical protein
MHEFSAAVADEVALARSELWSAGQRRDESGVTCALERLRDLREISERARDGVRGSARSATTTPTMPAP